MKKTFIFYTDWIDYTKEMNREEKGLFLETILAYQNGEDLPNDINPIKFIWSRIKKQLDEDNNKWSEELDKRKEAGKLGGIAKASKSKQVLADNENVNVNENVNENNITIDNSKELQQSGIVKTDNRNSDINKMQEFIKEKVVGLGYIYKGGQQERNRILNILTAKGINEIADKHNMSIYEFVGNIFDLSNKLDFWNGKINNAETFYKHYAKIYNDGLSLKQKKEAEKPQNIIIDNKYF